MDTFILSRLLFQYLSRLFGSEKAVQVRRLFYLIDDCCNIRTSERVVNSGSKAEGLDFPGSDIDLMIIHTERVVFPDIRSCPPNDCFSLYISTDVTPPGFAHINMRTNTYGQNIKLIWDNRVVQTAHGAILQNSFFKTSLLESMGYMIDPSIFKQHGPCIATRDNTHDLLFAFELHCWPNVASSWISRPLLYDWPTSRLISNIVHESVLLVPIGSKLGSLQDNPNEWRISFSLSEKLLVHSFNHTQLMCYALLKILLKEILNKNEATKNLLCSYFMKTILFWTIEETGCSAWTPDNLVKCFRSCIMKLLYLLKQKQLPNYFIPENNMIEGKFSEKMISNLCTVLDLVHVEGINFTARTETLKDFLTTSHGKMYIECQSDEISVFSSLINYSYFKNRCSVFELSQKPLRIFQLLDIFKTKLIRTIVYVRFLNDMSSFPMQSYYNLNGSNKRLYCNYKNFIGYSLIGSKVCLLSWLVLAIIFYSHKNYHNTLRITDFIKSENSLTKRCSIKTISTMRGRISFLRRLKLLRCMSFSGRPWSVPPRNGILPETDLLSFIIPFFCLTPVRVTRLLLTFVRFMSFHHLNDLSKRGIEFNDIIELFNEINEETSISLCQGAYVSRACIISHKKLPDNYVSKMDSLFMKFNLSMELGDGDMFIDQPTYIDTGTCMNATGQNLIFQVSK